MASETEAMRDMDMKQNRKWKIVNANKKNALGGNIGYALVPGANSVIYASEKSSVYQRAGFTHHHFWVTPYKPGEMYASGDYPNQSKPGQGLPEWVSDNESLVGKDLVVWYTMGVTHIPRPEEWPVMPVHQAGFKLIPTGFFTKNPALDLPSLSAKRQ
jgi:primary-amine oxidase